VGQAIGDFLPAAVGIAISPLPIVASVLILVSAHGRVNSLAYLAGWLVGLLGAGVVLLLLAGTAGADDDGQPADWASWLKLLLGLGLLALATKQFRGRPHGDEEPVTPKWMGALDSFTVLQAAGAGIVFALNPKNLLLLVAGMTGIAQAGLSTGDEAVSLVVFTLIATLGVATPAVLYFALGDRSQPLLDRLKAWMAHNNAVIMAIILLVIGVKLIGDAIAGLSG
jgi:hypothetical protein